MDFMDFWTNIDYQAFNSPSGMDQMDQVRRLLLLSPILDFNGFFGDFTPFLVPHYYQRGVRQPASRFCTKFWGVGRWSKIVSRRNMKQLFGTKLH